MKFCRDKNHFMTLKMIFQYIGIFTNGTVCEGNDEDEAQYKIKIVAESGRELGHPE